MIEVRPERAQLFESALSRALDGDPQLLCIEGDPGVGKTSHLRALLSMATPFRVLSAYGFESSYRPAYGILEQLGIPRVSTDAGMAHNPAIAAQSLRRLIDGQSRGEPLLLAIDDAQWADQESLEALRLVLEGVRGDRLLVVVANRTLTRDQHRRWQRHCREPGAATVLRLDGINLAEATAIARSVGGEEATALAERLWRHTDGNPLHLRALLAEYQIGTLAELTELPAPSDVALDLNARLAAMDPSAAELLRGVAVLGSSWVDRIDAATVACVDDAHAAVDLLIGSGLLTVEADSALARVRIVHALTRAAIYQSIPDAHRRAMHRTAAATLTSQLARLEHAVAAVDRGDDTLASQLEAAAEGAHEASDYRREARLLQWAAQVATTPERRERDWLEAQLATVLSLDTRSVRARFTEIGWATDVARRVVVLAWLLVAENRIADARRTLEALPDGELESADPRTRSRILVLTAWTMLMSGYPTGRIKALLSQLPDGDLGDPALRGYHLRTTGQIAAREADFEHIRRDFEATPGHPAETPMRHTERLAWRGAVYALCGLAAEARRDLGEVVARIRGGRVDAGSGTSHALYGFALWQDAEIGLADVEFRAAADLAADLVHPLVQAALPLVPAVLGSLERADELLASSEAVLSDLPWHEAIALHAQASVVRCHADPDDAARTSCLPRLRSAFGTEVDSPANAEGAIWHLHIAMARIWAGELGQIDAHLRAIETDMIVPGWAAWARPWLLGLRDEAGNPRRACELLARAASASGRELPLYVAHLHRDLSRVALTLGDQSTANRAADVARDGYARIGATSYLAKLDARMGATGDPLAALSDRERAVASLLLGGLSYAQIAEELYVTRSTVAFHLGNIYAKTGVATRHELIRLVRASA